MSTRSVKISRVGTDYVNKYLRTQVLNGRLQIVNATGDALYFFQGSEILDNVNVILPVLQGDDTIAFQNNNNNFGGIQTFTKGIVSQGGLLLLPDPLGQLEDDLTITDGLNVVLGVNQGSSIGTDPTQLLGFFGASPISQPGVTVPSTGTTMIQDMWNALVNLGLLSPAAASGAASITFGTNAPLGPLPSQTGYRYGIYQADNTTPAGTGLLSALTKTTSTGTVASTFINNRPAVNFPAGSSAGNFGGFRTTNPMFTPQLNPILKFKVALSTNTTDRLILGCASSTSLTTGFNTVLNNISGFMIGFGSGDTAYSVVTNNGAASQTNNTTGMPALQTAGTTAIFTLAWTNSNTTLTWSVQTAANTTTSGTINTGNLPAGTTQMYLYCTSQTNSTAPTLTVEDVELSINPTLDMTVF